ncbi:MAG TPA: response regulator [Sulfurimonas sp.]|nr:response regulator [Sulfurimonas sp.]
MDFASILTIITDFFSSIPSEIFGIDTLYIALGIIAFLILIKGVKKVTKAKPKRELIELITEEKSYEDSNKTENNEEELEDGFMPSNISSGIEESNQPEIDEEFEIPVEIPSYSEAKPVRKTENILRKKRESTRDGRNISKADFSDFSGRRLLIAEDNLINQKVLNGVLSESGIDIIMVDDGRFVMDALEKDSNFEIILMDAHMPRVDGFEATRMIRENPAYDHIVVVALSGDTAVDDIRHMTEAGMEEHLEKPLKMDALYDVMSMYFSIDEEKEEECFVLEPAELEISVDIDDLPCLDYDGGLEICGHDETMYKELLKEFFLGYKDSSKKMYEALVKKDYKGAQDILIDVKGTASNLGAVQFITITEHFLQALANENKASYSQLFKNYQKYLLALLKSIQAAFKA